LFQPLFFLDRAVLMHRNSFENVDIGRDQIVLASQLEATQLRRNLAVQVLKWRPRWSMPRSPFIAG
jgi:hypothetical protein